MEKANKKHLFASVSLLAAFILWTVAISFIDVKAIGPLNSAVGFSEINGFIHNLIGVHMSLYTITDWLGLIPVFFAIGFAILGLIQWIKRKNVFKVDRNILVLGGLYIITFAAYLLFEEFVINYRPVLIEGYLEASYPSSTTLLVLCIMPTAAMQLSVRIKNVALKRCLVTIIWAFAVLMVIGRLISGVHWLTDIIGSILLSSGLITMYYYLAQF